MHPLAGMWKSRLFAAARLATPRLRRCSVIQQMTRRIGIPARGCDKALQGARSGVETATHGRSLSPSQAEVHLGITRRVTSDQAVRATLGSMFHTADAKLARRLGSESWIKEAEAAERRIELRRKEANP